MCCRSSDSDTELEMATSQSTSEKAKLSSKESKAIVESFAAALKKKGIKLLALDFDKTFVDIHSRGLWTDKPEKLASFVRPCMRDFLVAASSKGVFTAIVTYSSQAGLIKEVLQIVLPKKVANKVQVVANTPEFLTRHESTDLNGKEAHIAVVISAIEQEHKVMVKNNEVLLLDDDMDNVRKAVSIGHYAFQVQQSIDYTTFTSYETMLLI